MSSYKYKLECGHILTFSRKVKLKDGKRWCKACRQLKIVLEVKIEKFIQKKLQDKTKKIEG